MSDSSESHGWFREAESDACDAPAGRGLQGVREAASTMGPATGQGSPARRRRKGARTRTPSDLLR